MVGRIVALFLFLEVNIKLNLEYVQQKCMAYLLPLYPSTLRQMILNASRLNSRVARNSCSHLREIYCVCFASKQTLHSILSGARSLVLNSVSSTPITCFRSCAIALGPIWPRILCRLIAVALTSLQAIQLGQYLLEVKNIN